MNEEEFTREELQLLGTNTLVAIANGNGVDTLGCSREDLIQKILDAQKSPAPGEPVDMNTSFARTIISYIEGGEMDAHILDIAKACVARRRVLDPILVVNIRQEIRAVLTSDPDRSAWSMRIPAIKRYRELTREGLADSKRWVEALIAEEGLG